MQTREEAMRAAADKAPGRSSYMTVVHDGQSIATAGGDTELARVVEWLRDMPIAQLGPLIGLSDLSDFAGGSDEAEFRTFLRGVARLAEAHVHWPRKDEQ